MNDKMTTDVIIIGGGATGAGIARDCALRGIPCILIEKSDISTGATGRNHGLLHSGARYAVHDHESAVECIQENKILKQIARHCVEETQGLFISLPEDDLDYQKRFLLACHDAGIDTQLLTAKETLAFETVVNPDVISSVIVPDGTVDPFRLTLANILDAQHHGDSKILTYTEVTALLKENDRIVGVKVYDYKTKEAYTIRAKLVINAAGVWSYGIAKMAGITLNIFPSKGSLLIFNHRVNHRVINRCRKASNADILVPSDSICLIGTTSTHVNYEDVDNNIVTHDEVDVLLKEGAKLAPILSQTKVLRAYAGVRPLIALDDSSDGRNISRGIVLLDHETRDNIGGFITISGGKLMTYRLMAEKTVDLICQKLNSTETCQTDKQPLPGSAMSMKEILNQLEHIKSPVIKQSYITRHGDNAIKIKEEIISSSLVCECEEVTYGEMEYSVNNLKINNLVDLRRRNRIGMGPCQGEVCAHRAAGLLNVFNALPEEKCIAALKDFLNERWSGMYCICWDDTLRENQLTEWVYKTICGL